MTPARGSTAAATISSFFVSKSTAAAAISGTSTSSRRAGSRIVRDELEAIDGEGIGGPVIRRVTAAPPDTYRGRMALDERRPWDPDPPLSQPRRRGRPDRPGGGGAFPRRAAELARGGMSDITVSVDLRALFGPARDQGPRPTCLAFAASDAHAALAMGWAPLVLRVCLLPGSAAGGPATGYGRAAVFDAGGAARGWAAGGSGLALSAGDAGGCRVLDAAG